MYKHLFGPVISRRLGRSLGIDLVPFRTCSFDCVFCQAGVTEVSTVERREYVLIADVVAEFEQWFNTGGRADYVTLSGTGEPTLHSKFGDVFDTVHKQSDIKTALLSNSSLFMLPEVRSDAVKSDLVKVSLSAWNDEILQRVNRPHSSVNLEDIVNGLKLFRKEYSGWMALEVFVLNGINDSESDMRNIAKLADQISPNIVQLNTVVRPPAEQAATCVDYKRLESFTRIFNLETEVIAPK